MKVVLLLLLMLFPVTLVALGMGEITLNSGLNQPLDARVELVAATPDQLEDIKVRLASAAQFEKAGVERPFVLSKLRFQPKVSKIGGLFIQITSRQVIVEPFLNFMIEMDLTGGRYLREYAILLDPPPFRSAVEPGAKPSSAVLSRVSGERYGPVAAGETLWGIAERTRHPAGVTVEQMMLGLQRHNPQAFDGGNINRLKRGVVLDIPARGVMLAMGAAEAKSAFRQQLQQWQKRPPPPLAVTTPERVHSPGSAEPTAQEPAESELKLVENSGKQSASGEGRVAYPVDESDRLHETILDTAGDLAAARDINKGLAELKDKLALQMDQLRRALEERDEVIARLSQQLDELEMTGQAASMSESLLPAATTAEAPPAIASPSTASEANSKLLSIDFSLPSYNSGRSWISDYWLLLITIIVMITAIVLGILWRGRGRHDLSDPHADMELFQAIPIDMPVVEDSLLMATKLDNPGESALYQVSENLSNANSDAASVMMEVDIYLAYRRFSQAELLVNTAITTFPESVELKAKLLEIYLFQENREAFSDYLDEVRPLLTRAPSAVWGHIVEMGLDLVPDHPVLVSLAVAWEQGGASEAGQLLNSESFIAGDEIDNMEIDLEIDIDSLLDTSSVLTRFADDEQKIPALGGRGGVLGGSALDALEQPEVTAQEVVTDELISLDALNLSDLEAIDFNLDLKEENKA
ncbi:MAG: FimV/HubP family polar landmark protein [Sedimenticola sp.]